MKKRSIHFCAKTKNGDAVFVVRKGWSVKRGDVVNRLARDGCIGDVMAMYFEDTKIVRTVRCGI